MSPSSKRPWGIIYWGIQEYTGKHACCLISSLDIYGYCQRQDTWCSTINFYGFALGGNIIFLEEKISWSVAQKAADSDEIQIISVYSNV